ncbi:MAG: isoprenylcysteine carboxylmethyltransferase family protein [Chloroflexota bacterium]
MSQRKNTTTAHLRSILLLPFTVTVIIPMLLLATGKRERHAAPEWLIKSCAIAGCGSIGYGLSLLIRTVRMFRRDGDGTLAPWDPTHRLVVVGIYRYVRNPMITGVALILFGEWLLTRSWRMFGWLSVFVGGNMIYIPLSEEPGLVRRFGDDYLAYRAAVPRWIPRRHPWVQDAQHEPSK